MYHKLQQRNLLDVFSDPTPTVCLIQNLHKPFEIQVWLCYAFLLNKKGIFISNPKPNYVLFVIYMYGIHYTSFIHLDKKYSKRKTQEESTKI